MASFSMIFMSVFMLLGLGACGDPKVELRFYGINATGQQVERDEVEAVKATYELLRRDIPRDYSDESGNTLLHQSAVLNHTYVGGVLIFNRFDVDAKNLAGMTPLHLAAFWGQLEFVDLLLSNDADPFVRDDRGKQAVDLAIDRLDRLEESEDKAHQSRLIFAIQSEMQRELIKRARAKSLEISRDER